MTTVTDTNYLALLGQQMVVGTQLERTPRDNATAVQGSSVAGAIQASQSPSQMGNKSRVTRKMGSIKDSTSVLAMANYVDSRRIKVNRKELTIDSTMESRVAI